MRDTTLSPQSPRGRLHRQIYVVIATALGLFVTSTFILSTYIPSPTDVHNHDGSPVFHSVAHVVGRGHQLHELRFEEPKGHLRRIKNDMRTQDLSKSSDENDDREEAEEEDDGENNDDNNKDNDDEEEEVPNYIKNDDMNRDCSYAGRSNDPTGRNQERTS